MLAVWLCLRSAIPSGTRVGSKGDRNWQPMLEWGGSKHELTSYSVSAIGEWGRKKEGEKKECLP